MQNQSSSRLQLTLGTGAFALCFAVFGSMSAMMPIISKHMALTPVQKSVAIAIPVLLGSLGRIPLGILTDRFGGRLVFSLRGVGVLIPDQELLLSSRAQRGICFCLIPRKKQIPRAKTPALVMTILE